MNKPPEKNTEDSAILVPQSTRRYTGAQTDMQNLLSQMATTSPREVVALAKIMAQRDVKLAESDNRTALELAQIELKKARLKTREYASPPPPSPSCPISPREDSTHGNRANVFLIATTIAAAALAVAMGVDQYQVYRNRKQDEAYNSLHNKIDVGQSRILPDDDDPETQISINKLADLEANIVQRFEGLFEDKDVFIDEGLIAWRTNDGKHLAVDCTDCCGKAAEGATCGSLIGLDIHGSSFASDGRFQPPYVSVSSQYGDHQFGATDIGGDGLADEGFVQDGEQLQRLEPIDQDAIMNGLLNGVGSKIEL